MKIELTDKQVDDFLEQISIEKLSAHLSKNPRKGFTLIKHLMLTAFHTETYVSKLSDFLLRIPIQKELF